MLNFFNRLVYSVQKLIKSLTVSRRGILVCRAFYKEDEILALLLLYEHRKLIKSFKTPLSIKIKAGSYHVEANYMSYMIEKDVEIKEGETVKKHFKFPSGVLECKTYEGSREVKAEVEVISKETGELVVKRTTPFVVHLEAGRYTLRVKYTPSAQIAQNAGK